MQKQEMKLEIIDLTHFPDRETSRKNQEYASQLYGKAISIYERKKRRVETYETDFSNVTLTGDKIPSMPLCVLVKTGGHEKYCKAILLDPENKDEFKKVFSEHYIPKFLTQRFFPFYPNPYITIPLQDNCSIDRYGRSVLEREAKLLPYELRKIEAYQYLKSEGVHIPKELFSNVFNLANTSKIWGGYLPGLKQYLEENKLDLNVDLEILLNALFIVGNKTLTKTPS